MGDERYLTRAAAYSELLGACQRMAPGSGTLQIRFQDPEDGRGGVMYNLDCEDDFTEACLCFAEQGACVAVFVRAASRMEAGNHAREEGRMQTRLERHARELRWRAGQGDLVRMRELIRVRGWDVVMPANREGKTSLFIAATHGNHDAVELILGADPARSKKLLMQTTSDAALAATCLWNGMSCLCAAAFKGHLRVVETLVAAGGKSLMMRTTGGGRSCLFLAAREGHAGVTRLLVEAGGTELVMLTSRGGHYQDTSGYGSGESCLLAAAHSGHVDIVKFLVKAVGRELLMLTSDHAYSCLHVAVLAGREEVVEHLTETGGRQLVMAITEFGDSCLYLAAARGRLSIARRLVEAGGWELIDSTMDDEHSHRVLAVTREWYATNQLLALSMGSHSRLGDQSVVGILGSEILEMVAAMMRSPIV